MSARHTGTMAVIVILGLSGCGDAADEPEDSPDAAEPEDEIAEPSDGPTLTVRDIAFQDESVTVEAGTPVTWDNEDGVAHTVTSGTPGEATDVFDEELPAGEQVTITVDEAGTYPYWCRIHPTMTAELVVEPAESS